MSFESCTCMYLMLTCLSLTEVIVVCLGQINHHSFFFTLFQCFDLSEEMLEAREVVDVDIAFDEVPEKHYVPEEDCRYFKSKKTGRGPLEDGWKDNAKPIMCSYKLVSVSFDVWALASRVESFVHRIIQDILLLGHRQAFAWIDNWIDMDIEDVRDYEKDMQEKTNHKVGAEI